MSAAERPSVLLVDDEVAFLSATRRWLDRSFEVTTTEDGESALQLLGQRSFDCLVADVKLPGMDGFELLLRAAELAPGTGRIAMSAFANSAALIDAINRGAVMAFLIKPFTYQDVSAAIYRSISRARSARAGGKVLVLAGDDAGQLQQALLGADLICQPCADAAELERRLERGGWDVAVVDLDRPDALDALHSAARFHPAVWPLVLTNERSRLLAQDLEQLGAQDTVSKPLHGPELLLRVQRLVTKRRARAAEEPPAVEQGQAAIVGESGAMVSLRQLIRTVASVECSVLICGETGTGKELVATALHQQGQRRSGPFLAVNCAALTETLFESEVFGHERGAFTGAVQQKRGLCELARGGTLLLDEIGELSQASQAKLLRFLETGEFFRVGGTEAIMSDARVLAATNRELRRMIGEDRFRSDLYHRLSTIEIFVPPLREHREDIPQLVSHGLAQLARRHGRSEISIDPEALQELMAYDWPGNVRELLSALERGLLLSPDGRIRPGLVAVPTPGEAPSRAALIDISVPLRQALDRVSQQTEYEYMVRMLAACRGNVSQAARRSGMDRRNFYRRLEALEIDPAQFREG